jgi:hypothetical protein
MRAKPARTRACSCAPAGTRHPSLSPKPERPLKVTPAAAHEDQLPESGVKIAPVPGPLRLKSSLPIDNIGISGQDQTMRPVQFPAARLHADLCRRASAAAHPGAAGLRDSCPRYFCGRGQGCPQAPR